MAPRHRCRPAAIDREGRKRRRGGPAGAAGGQPARNHPGQGEDSLGLRPQGGGVKRVPRSGHGRPIMIPPSTTPSVGEARSHESGHGYGLVLFASILLVIVGCFNIIYGIAAIAQSHVFVANAHYVFANQLACWFAVVMIGLNAIDQMFFIPAYPFWSLTIIAMDVVALYGLSAYGSRGN